ncbi:replicative DNA helicase [Methylobacterium brachythecii]|uniref:DNA 5'-3' helicase n=1 Tax=Methylobacterium brachythecii TaxID=1176177 RepID=A0A7W6AQZ9_9HYPH|nr:replicative DNA helicase [Methylobacterium brachythecii]MBB3905101.1 replicative DNA helicase [Methylobacterium brachythecii]GLS44391.1 replicative DNA helicase [Methylobacterium brachythecii]
MNERFEPDYSDVVPLRRPPAGVQARPGAAPGDIYPIASVETEQGLLGCILTNPHVFPLVQHLVASEHFAEPIHQAIWEGMAEVTAAGDTPNLLKVAAALGPAFTKRDLGNGQTGMVYLVQCAGGGCTPIGADEHARTIQQYWQLRALHAATSRAGEAAGYVPGPLLSQVYARVDSVRASFIDRKVKSATAGEAGDALMERIQKSLQGNGERRPKTGIDMLDREIGGGLQKSFLITLGARTSMGKSIVGVEVGSNVGRQGVLAIYHSLEMSREQIAARRASSWLFAHGSHDIPYEQMMREDGLSDAQAQLVGDAVYKMRGEHFHIEDGGGRTIGDIAAASDRLANSYARRGIPLGTVIIDHAHIVKPSRSFNREDEGLKEVADGALELAKHLDTTVLLLAQLNRKTESRAQDERRPTLADLRGAGAFEENSDVVGFLYRPAYYVERSSAFRNGKTEAHIEYDGCKYDLEIIIEKNRAGRANHIVRAWIDPALNAVRNLQHGS